MSDNVEKRFEPDIYIHIIFLYFNLSFLYLILQNVLPLSMWTLQHRVKLIKMVLLWPLD